MSSALVFIFVLSVLVVVHEFGHLIVAKWTGVRVEKFSIGFGPVIFGRKFGETEFCVSLLPLGGFVKLAGESPEEVKGEPWEFNSKALWQKLLIVLAGPVMNAVLAFVIFWAIFIVGQPTLTTKIGRVLEGTPAQQAGLREGDRVLAVNGATVRLWEEVLAAVHGGGDKIVFTIERDGGTREIPVAPRFQEGRSLAGRKTSVGFVGVAPSNEMAYVKSGFFKAMVLAAERVWMMTAMIFYSLGLMVTGALSFKDS